MNLLMNILLLMHLLVLLWKLRYFWCLTGWLVHLLVEMLRILMLTDFLIDLIRKRFFISWLRVVLCTDKWRLGHVSITLVYFKLLICSWLIKFLVNMMVLSLHLIGLSFFILYLLLLLTAIMCVVNLLLRLVCCLSRWMLIHLSVIVRLHNFILGLPLIVLNFVTLWL